MKLPLALGTPHKWFTWLDVITCFCWKLKVKSNLIQRVTTEFPYVGKLITSRILRLCQVSQKWPVIFLWLLLMLDYINYFSPAQQGFRTCFATEIWCLVIKGKVHILVKLVEVCATNYFAELLLLAAPVYWGVYSRRQTVSNRRRCCCFTGMHPPGPPLARPVLPRERGAMDRFIEYLVGDGPQNRCTISCKVEAILLNNALKCGDDVLYHVYITNILLINTNDRIIFINLTYRNLPDILVVKLVLQCR